MRRLTIGLFASLCFVPMGLGQSPQEKQATIAYVRELQTSEGGFLAAPARSGQPAVPSLRATSAAMRVFKYFGGQPKDKAVAGRYVMSCFDESSGGFADQPKGKPDVATTAVGLMAGVELGLPLDKIQQPAVAYLTRQTKSFEEIRIAAAGLEAIGVKSPAAPEWQKQIDAMRNPDGSYGKSDGVARETGGAVAAALRLGAAVAKPESIIRALNAGQRQDGGFGKAGATGSDLETTYRVMRTYHMLKAKPAEADRCRAFVAKCRNDDGGYGVAPGQPSAVGSTYYAAIILHWLDAAIILHRPDEKG